MHVDSCLVAMDVELIVGWNMLFEYVYTCLAAMMNMLMHSRASHLAKQAHEECGKVS